VVVQWHARGLAEGTGGQGDAMPASRPATTGAVWRLNSSDHFVMREAQQESDVGEIEHVRSGRRVAAWETGSIARFFGTPIAFGSYPEQWVFVSYHVGGGTGLALFHWCIIQMTDSGSRFNDMGLYRYSCVWRNQFKFQVSPDLTQANNWRFRFRQIQRVGNKVDVIDGRVSLILRTDKRPLFMPVGAFDARALVQLLESPVEYVRGWAGEVIANCLPVDHARMLSAKDWKLTDADKQALSQALKVYFSRRH